MMLALRPIAAVVAKCIALLLAVGDVIDRNGDEFSGAGRILCLTGAGAEKEQSKSDHQ